MHACHMMGEAWGDPLPFHSTICRYHHNAYFAQQVGEVVRQEMPEKFVDYIQLMFDNQDSKRALCFTLGYILKHCTKRSVGL